MDEGKGGRVTLRRRSSDRWRGVGVAGLLALVASLAFVAKRVRAAVERAQEVPLSPLVARFRVGEDYLERHGVETGDSLSGEMDDAAEFAGPGFDPDELDPRVREFYEHTAEYELAYGVRWHRGFRLGAALAARLTSRVEQLNLPGPGGSGGVLRSRIVAVDDGSDPRDGARAWIRTDETGDAVFVAIYASHVRDGRRYINIAAPLPWSNLSTVLRTGNLPDGGMELAARETCEPSDERVSNNERRSREARATDSAVASSASERGERATGDEGLYLVTPLGAITLPLSQTFRVRPDGDGVRASHEMWVFGRQFLTVEYVGRRPDGD